MKPILFLCSIEDLISCVQGGFSKEIIGGLSTGLFLPTENRNVAMWHLTANGQIRSMMRRLIIKAENSGRIEWSVRSDWPYVTAKAMNNLMARNFGPGTPRLRELFVPLGGRPAPFGPLDALDALDELQLPVHVCTKPVGFTLSLW